MSISTSDFQFILSFICTWHGKKIFADVCDLDLRTKCSCGRGQWLWQRALMAHWLWRECLWGRKSLGDPQLPRLLIWNQAPAETEVLQYSRVHLSHCSNNLNRIEEPSKQTAQVSACYNSYYSISRHSEMAFHILLVGPISSELFCPFLFGAACASSERPGSASRDASSGPIKTSV